MHEIIITTTKEKTVTIEELHSLKKEAFKQWLEKGLNVAFADDEYFGLYLQDKVVFVAYDAATGELLGMHNLKLYKNKGCAWGANLAVVPHAKRQGVATRMLEEEVRWLCKKGYRYLTGGTGTPATWSVRWHLKNGYRIVGYSRSELNNYASYVFRKQIAYDIKHHPSDILWLPYVAPITACITYAVSYLVTRLCKTRSGRLNALGRLAKRLRT